MVSYSHAGMEPETDAHLSNRFVVENEHVPCSKTLRLLTSSSVLRDERLLQHRCRGDRDAPSSSFGLQFPYADLPGHGGVGWTGSGYLLLLVHSTQIQSELQDDVQRYRGL